MVAPGFADNQLNIRRSLAGYCRRNSFSPLDGLDARHHEISGRLVQGEISPAIHVRQTVLTYYKRVI